MSIFPEEFIRIAATGSNPRTKASVEQSRFPLLKNWKSDDIPEQELLISIAAYALQNQAGYIPATCPDNLLAKAQLSEKQACNITAQQHLKLMLNHVHEELLPYWIDEIHKHDQRIPDEMLPSMLDYGSKRPTDYELLRKAVGERGYWLVQQANNSNWDKILQEGDDEAISENHYTAWEGYFRRMRRDDPVRALNILRPHWDELDTLMQMALLRAMHEGLNEHDADFLWKLFEEETTRFTAARCLLQIEDSEFAIKARENIGKLLSLISVGHRDQPAVDFTWSHTFEGHPLQINRQTANKLCHIMGYEFNPELMLMLLPLSYWYETYDVMPELLVSAAGNSTRPSVFYRIWTNMAIQEEDSDFLFALVMNVERHAVSSLVKHLSQSQLIEAATHWLRKKPLFSLQHNTIALLDVINTTWSEELAEIFLDSLEACFRQIPHPMLDENMRGTLKHYARLLPLSASAHFEQVLRINKQGDLNESEIGELNGIIDIIRFRTEMLEAIQAGRK